MIDIKTREGGQEHSEKSRFTTEEIIRQSVEPGEDLRETIKIAREEADRTGKKVYFTHNVEMVITPGISDKEAMEQYNEKLEHDTALHELEWMLEDLEAKKKK